MTWACEAGTCTTADAVKWVLPTLTAAVTAGRYTLPANTMHPDEQVASGLRWDPFASTAYADSTAAAEAGHCGQLRPTAACRRCGEPGLLAQLWNSALFGFADVHYRLEPHDQQAATPKDTIDFDADADADADRRARALAAQIGNDGLLVCDAQGQPVLATLAEKLAIILLGQGRRPGARRPVAAHPAAGMERRQQRAGGHRAVHRHAGAPAAPAVLPTGAPRAAARAVPVPRRWPACWATWPGRCCRWWTPRCSARAAVTACSTAATWSPRATAAPRCPRSTRCALAVQVQVFAAADGQHPALQGLKACCCRVRSGLGHHRSAAQYGAFPADPYSHTAGEGGTQQPGMTGQVQEEILTRRGELGLRVHAGQVELQRVLLDPHALPAGSALRFTWAGVPFAYRRGATTVVRVRRADGWQVCADHRFAAHDPARATRQARSRPSTILGRLFSPDGRRSRPDVTLPAASSQHRDLGSRGRDACGPQHRRQR